MCHQPGYNDLLRVSGYSQKRLLASSCFSVLPSVCPTVYMYHLDSHPTDVSEIWYWRLELKSVEKIQACLKYRAVFMTNKIRFVFTGNIKPHESTLRVKWYQAVKTAEEV